MNYISVIFMQIETLLCEIVRFEMMGIVFSGRSLRYIWIELSGMDNFNGGILYFVIGLIGLY